MFCFVLRAGGRAHCGNRSMRHPRHTQCSAAHAGGERLLAKRCCQYRRKPSPCPCRVHSAKGARSARTVQESIGESRAESSAHGPTHEWHRTPPMGQHPQSRPQQALMPRGASQGSSPAPAPRRTCKASASFFAAITACCGLRVRHKARAMKTHAERFQPLASKDHARLPTHGSGGLVL